MFDYTSDAVYRLTASLVGIKVAGEGSQGKIKGCSMCHCHIKSNFQAGKTKGIELHPGQLESTEKTNSFSMQEIIIFRNGSCVLGSKGLVN